jgi:hypothetical protein
MGKSGYRLMPSSSQHQKEVRGKLQAAAVLFPWTGGSVDPIAGLDMAKRNPLPPTRIELSPVI